MNRTRRLLTASLLLSVFVGIAHADQNVKPPPSPVGTWVKIGQVTATHKADHDRIVVRGPHDNFRKIKFRVTDSPLNLRHIVVTYDSGQPERVEVRQNIKKGGETRPIDLRGGKRSVRAIDFWYDTKGILNGKADVHIFGQH